jgi:hypothetical protein
MILKVHPVSFFFLLPVLCYLSLLAYYTQMYLSVASFGQAAYNVGGQSVNAQTIQNSILGCQSHRPSLVRAFANKNEKKKQTNKDHEIEQTKQTDVNEICSGSARCSRRRKDPRRGTRMRSSTQNPLRISRCRPERFRTHLYI